MTVKALPYLPRSYTENRLRDFLLQRLEPRPGLPKAVVLSGPPGVGKRTLLRHVFESDPRLRSYGFADLATREILASGGPPGGWKGKAADAAVAIWASQEPLTGTLAAVTLPHLKEKLAGTPAARTAVDPFLEGTSQPLLLVVPGFDPESQSTLRDLAYRVNQSRNAALPRALVILDDSLAVAQEPDAVSESRSGTSHGLGRLREYLADDRRVEVLSVSSFSDAQCRDSLMQLGLSAEWARLLFQLSDGRLAELGTLWSVFQEEGVIIPASGGRWKAVTPALDAASKYVHRRLKRLLEPRLPENSRHLDRLLRACHLAAMMGPTFIPQAVAEAIVAADPKRDEFDGDTWEDDWYHVLEHDDARHSAIAAPCMSGDQPRELQADERRCFVYAFRDVSLVHLLRATARQMWGDWKGARGEERPHDLFVAAGQALEAWLDRTFEQKWPQALPFRVPMLRIQRRDWEAGRLEAIDHRFRLLDRLRSRVAQERRRVQQGHEAGDLYACLTWYADVLHDIGRYPAEASILLEASELADGGRVALDRARRLELAGKLGYSLWRQGAHQEGEELLVWAFKECERTLGPDAPLTLTTANNVALLYLQLGRFGDAESLLKRVLEKDPERLTAANNLAGLFEEQGRYREAEPLALQALEGRTRTLGPDHTATLSSAGNLGTIYKAQGRYAEAERLYRQVLEGRTRMLGRDHPDTLFTMNSLGDLYWRQSRHDEAAPLFKRALEGLTRVLGPHHTETLRVANNLANLYHSLGRYDEAESLYARALHGTKQSLGPDHPDTIASMRSLGTLHLSRGRFAEAEQLLRRALEAHRQTLGSDHPETLISASNLAVLHDTQGHFDKAEPLLLQVLESRDKVLGADHPDTLFSVTNLAVFHFKGGRFGKAVPLFLRALEGRERILGPDHPATLEVREVLDTLRRMGVFPEDEPRG